MSDLCGWPMGIHSLQMRCELAWGHEGDHVPVGSAEDPVIAAAEERGRRWKEKEMETLRGAVTLANEEIRRLVAAAHDSEERGRRRGEAERDELRDRMHQTIAFLLSCVASGEQLSNEEEVGIRAMLREALAPRDSAPVCDAVLSSDPFREWRCGKLKGHEGPHSGEAPRDSGGTR